MSWWTDAASGVERAGGSLTRPAADAGTGFDWGKLIEVGAPIVGSLAQGYLANQGADAAADAQTGANQASINLQRDIYNDQARRSAPWEQSGGNALNFINAWNGLPQVSLAGQGGNGLGVSNSSLLPNLGAGQPVTGHSGGGKNGLASGLGSAAGTAIGTTFGGPIGGFIGGALGGAAGGMFHQSGSGGDNWQTLATQAPPGFDYETYMQNPGLQAEWAKPDVQSLFGGNRDAYANWHYNKFGPNGANEGWVLNPLASQSAVPGSTASGPTGGNGLVAPDVMKAIQDNPIYKSAVDGFLGINGLGGDVQDVRGAYATNGQAMSGAELKALHDRSTARSGDAVNRIYGNIANEAGVGYTAAAGTNQNAGAMGANVGNMLTANGQVAGQASQQKNTNWMTALNNGLSGVYGAGKSQGWIN